ncbi:hypothetical protein N657DRAFT_643482 [Parathielavia appendiculata]|uniref:Uncharacterized protein n=1 Tax=Parathielavia appendiculata TaxID=2587402 RepID=A0AAN6Z4J9_9PEZI|nr:hypothetical protein N657DRAFT_643482 [Parathielavia appendiculata]
MPQIWPVTKQSMKPRLSIVHSPTNEADDDNTDNKATVNDNNDNNNKDHGCSPGSERESCGHPTH